ncbi:hypothetical protein G7Z17_g5510 [Cylindrodendrum hubeiense]|uniref:BZIP domain-containing protein n=1 Tax=Cylindrodendrum hubeiense TaxID=595255 RepID=A0A9P5HCS8_9HYPO|nr:hypothetical protein G7Z17_g5510 [Cylindrodendrum hubeiense]
MDIPHDDPNPEPCHQLMSIPSLSPSDCGPGDFSTTPPFAFEPRPPHLNHQPTHYYGQGFHLHHSQPTSPTASVFTFDLQQTQHYRRHYDVRSSIIPYISDLRISEAYDGLTPAQSRRKAQNRTAQQSFRKRRETHIKALEARLVDLETTRQQVSTENEHLKQSIKKVATENQILRITPQLGDMHEHSIASEPLTDLQSFNYFDFHSDGIQGELDNSTQEEIDNSPSYSTTCDDGERLLSAGATWDVIINHELFKEGLVDVGDVSEHLVGYAHFDGQGPLYSKRCIHMAIEQSVMSKADYLL